MKRRLLSLIISFIYFGLNSLIAQVPPSPYFTSCPSGGVYNLNPGQCDTVVHFTVTADGVQPVTVTQLQGLPSGSAFPLGLNILFFKATDANGDSSFCLFILDVKEYQPLTSALVCDDTVHISLDQTCVGFLYPDHVLEGDYGCYDIFKIRVNNTDTNIVDASMIGTYIMYNITHTETGNNCMGTGLVQDKLPPVFISCDPVAIHSYQNPKPSTEGGDVPIPTITDCSQFKLTYSDILYRGECSDGYRELIARTWEAVDAFGNKSTCVQLITVRRVSLIQTQPLVIGVTPVCPPSYQTECVPGTMPDLRPEITGYPTVLIDGINYPVLPGTSSQCRLSSTYSDKVITMCGGSYQVLRTWKVVDCCLDGILGVNPWSCIQVINVSDKTNPLIQPVPDMLVSLDVNMCTARPIIPAVKITDCSDVVMEIITPVGSIYTNGGRVPPPGLPVGDHTIIVNAVDKCGNPSSRSFVIRVRDTQKPVAACKQFMVVALNSQGVGIAAASAFNLGSNDNCCLGEMKVARMSDKCGNPNATQFGDFVEFCCGDVGDTVQVIFRVYDCHGNFNDCMLRVEVQDQLPPTLTCPPDITINCRQGYLNQEVTGRVVFDANNRRANDGLATDNCINQLQLNSSDIGSVTCGLGTIFRTFTVKDIAGFDTFCIQTINVTQGPPLTNQDFIFPRDTTVGNCGAGTFPAVTGYPILPSLGICDSFTVAFKDSIVNNTLGFCQVVFRKWVIVDLCIYNPNVPNSPGRWEHTQLIYVNDKTAPIIADCLPRKFCNFKDDCGFIAPNLSISVSDNCTPANQITLNWVVDLYNDGIPDVGAIYAGTGQNFENFYDYGTHKITYQVSDGCGNTATCSFLFTIEDCKKPNVFCKPSVTVQLNAGGLVSVNARILDTGASRDNCTSQSQLRYSFTPNATDTIRTYTCLHKGSNAVKLWVTDLTNNTDSCLSFIIVEDSQNPCPGGLMAFGGKVSTEANSGVKDVNLQLSGSLAGMAYTDASGQFSFESVPAGKDYSITPSLNGHALTGVTTYDMVLLQRHILGIQPLDSPYKIIAGDVNRNNVLTTSDLVDMRRVILHILPQFPNNTSWRFIDGTFVFSDKLNPWSSAFREVYNVNNLTSSSPKPNFVAVKVGDVNGSAAGANILSGVDLRSTEKDWLLLAEDRNFQKGETFRVDFTSSLEGLLAYQFTLNFNPALLSVLEVVPGYGTDHSNFGTTLLEQGAVTAGWGRVNSMAEQSDEAIFSIVFQSRANGSLSQTVSLNSRFTQAGAFDKNGQSRAVQLQFVNNTLAERVFELMQNKPNPFKDQTAIGFELPEATTATLTVFDISGRQITGFKGEYAAGYNEISIDEHLLPGHGVYYYRLETPKHTATMKMTFLR